MAKKVENYKKLYRSETNRVLAGVAGGLGEYFNVDPLLLRLIFILLTVFGGGGVLIYVILWILIPCESCVDKTSEETIRQNAEELKEKAKNFAHEFRGMSTQEHPRSWLGIFIIILGILFLFDNLGFLRFNFFWPLILIAFGLFILFK